jgi:ABC-type uncharacterized transport system substrate-binding protein
VLKRIFLFFLIVSLNAAAAVGADLSDSHVDILIPADNPSMHDLAKGMQHSLAHAHTGLVITIRTQKDTVPDQAARGLAIAIGDNLLSWSSSNQNPYAATINFYVSSIKFNAVNQPARSAALYRDQPLTRQLQLARLLLPNLQRVALIHGSDGPPANLAAIQRENNVTIETAAVNDKPDWAKLLSQLMIDNDVLLGLDDAEVYNSGTIRSILLTTYRRGKILIGPNRPFVTAGSLASAYTSSEQFLHQLNTMVGEYLQQGKLPESQYPKRYRIAINQQVAASLGLNLPDEKTLYESLQKKLGVCGDDC